MLGYQFIVKLNNKKKIDLIQIYLGARKLIVKYTDTKQTIKKVYQHFKESSFFNNLYNQL